MISYMEPKPFFQVHEQVPRSTESSLLTAIKMNGIFQLIHGINRYIDNITRLIHGITRSINTIMQLITGFTRPINGWGVRGRRGGGGGGPGAPTGPPAINQQSDAIN